MLRLSHTSLHLCHTPIRWSDRNPQLPLDFKGDVAGEVEAFRRKQQERFGLPTASPAANPAATPVDAAPSTNGVALAEGAPVSSGEAAVKGPSVAGSGNEEEGAAVDGAIARSDSSSSSSSNGTTLMEVDSVRA